MLGLLVLFGLPVLGNLYASVSAGGFVGILLRGVFCAVCLLVPTMLMGATLPAIARWVEATPDGVSWLGFFYGGNIAGAVIGCVLAGFYLLRVFDMATATYVAVAINAVVAIAAWLIASKKAPHTAVVAAAQRPSPAGARTSYLAIALSGLTAFGAEVVWTRLLSLMLGATVYTFSLILAVVLVGLGLGSSGGAYLARIVRRPRVVSGWCQLLLPVCIAWSAYMIAKSLPYWPINPTLSTNPWLMFQFDVMRCAGDPAGPRCSGVRASRWRSRRRPHRARMPAGWWAGCTRRTRLAGSSARRIQHHCDSGVWHAGRATADDRDRRCVRPDHAGVRMADSSKPGPVRPPAYAAALAGASSSLWPCLPAG